jgi:hypothetical protein
LNILKGELFVVIEESDLVDIIKQTTFKNLKLGIDVGLVSYNNTPFKEIFLAQTTQRRLANRKSDVAISLLWVLGRR